VRSDNEIQEVRYEKRETRSILYRKPYSLISSRKYQQAKAKDATKLKLALKRSNEITKHKNESDSVDRISLSKIAKNGNAFIETFSQ